MKRTAALCTIIFVLFISKHACAQLDSVLNNYFKATGQEKLAGVQTIRANGKIIQMGLEIPLVYYQVRPNMIRTEGTYMGKTFIAAYDGTEGWTINPFSGNAEPQPMAPEELKQKKLDADIDPMLWNYKQKGYIVTYEGIDSVRHSACHKIKVIMPDSDVYNLFIDATTFMLVRTNTKTTIQGIEVESDTYQSDFLQVDSISFPGKIETAYAGEIALSLEFSSFELNVPIDTTIFQNPRKE